MACGALTIGDFSQIGPFGPATVTHDRATRGEGAAGGDLGRARQIAFQHDAALARARIGARHGGEQRLRVRVLRRRVDCRFGPISTMRPRYITATRSAMWRTTARSCAMKR